MRTYEIETRTAEEQATAAMFATLTVDGIPAFLGRAYHEVAAYLSRYGVGPAGPPYARYHEVDDRTFEVEAGFPATTPVAGQGEIEPSDLPGGHLAVTVHVGPYEEMEPAYDALGRWIAEHGAVPEGDAWEVYHSDPGEVPDPAEWRTEVVQPYRRA